MLHLILLLVNINSSPLAATDPAPAYYHSDDIALKSALFAKGAEATNKAFDQAQQKIDVASQQLKTLDENAALIGRYAPDGFIDYTMGLRKSSTGQFLEIQAFVDVLTQDFSDTFGEALERAISSIEGYEITECKASGVHAMMGKSQCVGTDLNQQLASILDEDLILQTNLEEMLSITWPNFELSGQKQKAVEISGINNLLYLEDLTEEFLTPRIDAINARLQDKLDSVEALQEEGNDKEALTQGRIIRSIYEQDMNALGAIVIEQVKKTKNLPPDLGICPNPRSLGGCDGNDISEKAIEALKSNKKFIKSIGK